MRRLQDQLLVLEAITKLKHELEKAKHDSWVKQGEIAVRLATLYSLLDVETLKRVVTAADQRKQLSKEDVA